MGPKHGPLCARVVDGSAKCWMTYMDFPVYCCFFMP